MTVNPPDETANYRWPLNEPGEGRRTPVAGERQAILRVVAGLRAAGVWPDDPWLIDTGANPFCTCGKTRFLVPAPTGTGLLLCPACDCMAPM